MTTADVAALTPVMRAAFDDDPMVRWVYRDGARPRGSAAFFRWQMARLVGQGVSSVTDDQTGAAIWALPGTWKESLRQALSLVAMNAYSVGPRPHVLRGLAMVERLHPKAPHLYLGLTGVAPHLQGQGIGSALLGPGLALCDSDGLDAYLETTSARNVDYYVRHGFAVERELQMPAGGPPVWLMSRRPDGGSAELIGA